MKPFRTGLVFGASVLFAAVAFGSEVYKNDFSSRTSKKPVPANRWYETSYRSGASLAYTYGNADYAEGLPYSKTGEYQDSWVKAKSAQADVQPTLLVKSESGNKYVLVDSSACVKEKSTSVVMTPFYNDFTTGIVRISCDLRYFAGMLPTAGTSVRIRPLYKAVLDPGTDKETKVYPTAFGIHFDSSANAPRALLIAAKGDGTSQRTIFADAPNADVDQPDPSKFMQDGHWYRFVIDLDLDSQRSNGAVYDLGTAHPTFDSTGTACGNFGSGGTFNFFLDEEYGPLSGVAFNVNKVAAGADYDADKAPAYDNLSVAWMAPGTGDFQSVYENDFSTRRYRTLCPDGAKGFDYAPFEQTVISDRFSYVANNTWNKSLEDTTPLLPEPAAADPQPVGYDGWRRSNKSGTATAAVVKWDVTSTGVKIDAEKGGNVLKVCGGSGLGENNFLYAFAPLGETVASGVLTCSADVKTPSEWAPSSLSRYDIGVILANAAAYEEGEYTGNFAFRCGITGNPPSPDEKKSKRFEPYTNTETGWAPEDGTDYRLVSNTWYRIEMTVDLDNRSAGASLKIWEIGENSQARSFVPSVLKFEKTGIPFRNTVDGIGSIGLFASGAGAPTSKKTLIAFDNIVVTKNVGTAGETDVYVNVFSTRTRTFDAVATGRFVGTINNDDGADHWIRRASGTGACRIVDADNPCVAAWADGDSGSYAVHPLGKTVKSGSFQADIRPPSSWASRDASSRIASVVLGGDGFLQGCPSATSAFTTAAGAVTFGFTDTTNAKDQFGVCSNVQVYAWNGNGAGSGQRAFPTLSKALDTSHWYRFKADFSAADGTWSMKVYDMGATRPSVDDADGDLVAESADLGFRNPAQGGLSSYCFNTQGNAPVLANDPADPSLALYDNIVVTEEDRGVAIILR